MSPSVTAGTSKLLQDLEGTGVTRIEEVIVKQKTGFIPKFDDADLHRAVRAGRSARTDRLHAQSIRYDLAKDGIEIVLESGVTLFWPRTAIEEFAKVDPAQMRDICLSPRGAAIELEAADVDIDIGGLVADLVPAKEMAAALARHGRQTTSTDQSEAARRNGAKGGRPKKNPHQEMSEA